MNKTIFETCYAYNFRKPQAGKLLFFTSLFRSPTPWRGPTSQLYPDSAVSMLVINSRYVAGIATREDLRGLFQFAPTTIKVPILDAVHVLFTCHVSCCRRDLPSKVVYSRGENVFQDHFI